jgi:hypothetical protein
VLFLKYVNSVGFEIDGSNLICVPRCHVHQICSPSAQPAVAPQLKLQCTSSVSPPPDLAIVFKASLWRRLSVRASTELEHHGRHEFWEYGISLALEVSLWPDLDVQDATRRVNGARCHLSPSRPCGRQVASLLWWRN